MKKIMILGAGIYQVPLIQKAKEMGLITIVVSYRGNYPGFNYADKIYYEDTTDAEAILAIAEKEKIEAVCTSGTDVAIETLGRICEELGLKGIHANTGKLTTNKFSMKKAFEVGGVRSAKYRKIDSVNTAKNSIKELNLPVMFKAIDSSGSRGIIKVDSLDDIYSSFNYSIAATNKSYILAEEYLDGIEFGAQAAVVNGEIKFIMPHGDFLFKGKTDVPIGHFVPYNLSKSIKVDVEEQVKKTVKALKLDNCALNFDFILCNNKTYVLEVGARVGATCLAEHVSIHYDVDYYKYLINISLGEVSDKVIFAPKVANASLLFISPKSGVFSELDFDKSEYDIVDLKIDYKNGDQVKKFDVGPDRIGHVVIKGDDIELLKNDIDKLQNNYAVKLNYDTI